ncbi:hypothetical protein ACFFJ7_05420 [Pseudochelatococcus lubricantis]|uniref:hypothetical protein n=1 Tax=Pseudochelatococcus lubricantis TaxID=1538102 RepID=UPI0035E804C6
MVGYVQASARVPEEGRPVLLEIAAQMRADPSFIERAAVWIAATRAGDELADWRSEIERRLEALELQSSQVGTIESKQDDTTAGRIPAGNEGGIAADPVEGGRQADIEDLLSPVLDDPVEPAGAAVEAEDADWTAKAAAITTTTGEGKGRKLTEAGAGLFAEMLAAGVPLPSIARTVGISPQSAHTRAKKLAAGG